MKNKLYLNFLLIVAGGLIMASMAGCENGTTDNPIDTSTGKCLFIENISLTGNIVVVLADEITESPTMPAGGFGVTVDSSNNISISLRECREGKLSTTYPAWKGTGQYYVALWNGDDFNFPPGYYTSEKINFSTEITTIPWDKFQAWSDQ